MTAVLVPQRRVLRAVRGATLAVASALLAGTAHVAAGGSAPDGALATLLTLVVAATVSLTKNGETVRTITWTAGPGVRIRPGEYQEFDVSAGPLPEDTDQLVLPAVQTYGTATASGADTTARWIGGAGLAVGALGLGVGAGAVLRTRRASSS